MKNYDKPDALFSKFIVEEAKKRNVSLRKFADIVSVDSSTIIRAADPKTASMPSLEFLAKLADATGVDMCTLLALVLPQANITSDDARSQLLVQRIRKLPVQVQEIIESMIVNAVFNKSDTTD